MKLVLEIVAVVFTWAFMGGSAMAGMDIFHRIIMNLNRVLPANQQFSVRNYRHRMFDILREHRKMFPSSKLRIYMWWCDVSMVLGIVLLGVELTYFKTFRLVH